MNENQAPRDHYDPTDDMDDGSLERHVKSRSTWLRLFFMLVVMLLYGVSRVVVAAIVLIQFFTLLFKGETNDSLRELGQSLARYSYEIVRYLTFNTERRPYPFDAPWPSGRDELHAHDGSPADDVG